MGEYLQLRLFAFDDDLNSTDFSKILRWHTLCEVYVTRTDAPCCYNCCLHCVRRYSYEQRPYVTFYIKQLKWEDGAGRRSVSDLPFCDHCSRNCFCKYPSSEDDYSTKAALLSYIKAQLDEVSTELLQKFRVFEIVSEF